MIFKIIIFLSIIIIIFIIILKKLINIVKKKHVFYNVLKSCDYQWSVKRKFSRKIKMTVKEREKFKHWSTKAQWTNWLKMRLHQDNDIKRKMWQHRQTRKRERERGVGRRKRVEWEKNKWERQRHCNVGVGIVRFKGASINIKTWRRECGRGRIRGNRRVWKPGDKKVDSLVCWFCHVDLELLPGKKLSLWKKKISSSIFFPFNDYSYILILKTVLYFFSHRKIIFFRIDLFKINFRFKKICPLGKIVK